MAVRAGDGTRLHAEVFGPEDGYPIVLAHGITCAVRVWAYQIADLARDYRVIAYDHRGHGRSGMPTRRANYGLNFLAADLDAVLEATLEPGERAVLAGHSMGGIAISSWSERYPRRVRERADAVALINTTTGGDQEFPSVAWNGTQAVYVWSGNGPGDSSGIFFQRMDAALESAGGIAPVRAERRRASPSRAVEPVSRAIRSSRSLRRREPARSPIR